MSIFNAFKATRSCSTFQGSLRLFRSFTTSTNKLNSFCTIGECNVKELKFSVPYGHIAAKAWGKASGYPVLAFHGWLDNCGTFDRLMPLLSEDFYIMAIDAPGHGLSSHIPPGGIYSYTNLIVDSKRVVDSLGWKKFHIIGHSMGAELGFIYACFFPDSVHKLVILDIYKPTVRRLDLFPGVVVDGISAHFEIEKKMLNPPPVYTHKDAIERLMKGTYDELSMESAEIILKRGAKPSSCGNGVIFTRDLRVRLIESFSRTSYEMGKQFMSHVHAELLMILANNTHPKYVTSTTEVIDDFLEIYRKNCKKFIMKNVDGNHFVHLNNPERIAPLINEFLKK